MKTWTPSVATSTAPWNLRSPHFRRPFRSVPMSAQPASEPPAASTIISWPAATLTGGL
ncbi:MAG: hypothetical protein BWZ02_03225 [Lentisphaerae bacterium ADurb.BinA184]|nr:MAG: hypothetical protein BWZ02_03225 [Lentisphaerae bacterium ADurb.BinA184]